MTIELAAATRAGIGTGPAPIISRGSSGRMLSSGAIFLGVEIYTGQVIYLNTTSVYFNMQQLNTVSGDLMATVYIFAMGCCPDKPRSNDPWFANAVQASAHRR